MTIAELRAAYLEREEALQRLIESGGDPPADELARLCRLAAWAKREWKNAVDRERKQRAQAAAHILAMRLPA